MIRGGSSQLEIEHGKALAVGDPEETWGWGTPAGKERVAARVRWFRDICGLRPGIRVLECGCGTGIYTRSLAETGAEIVAVDISQDLLDYGRKRCSATNVTFKQVDLENPGNLEDTSFDVLIGVSILHHLELPKALVAIRSKLKHGALFAFSEPNIMNPINKYVMFTGDLDARKRHGMSPTEMAFHPAELTSLFCEAGYHVDSIAHRDFMHPAVPKPLIPIVRGVQYLAERTPIVRRWSGSLWVNGYLEKI